MAPRPEPAPCRNNLQGHYRASGERRPANSGVKSLMDMDDLVLWKLY